jgi:hypothetical protein
MAQVDTTVTFIANEQTLPTDGKPLSGWRTRTTQSYGVGLHGSRHRSGLPRGGRPTPNLVPIARLSARFVLGDNQYTEAADDALLEPLREVGPPGT